MWAVALLMASIALGVFLCAGICQQPAYARARVVLAQRRLAHLPANLRVLQLLYLVL